MKKANKGHELPAPKGAEEALDGDEVSSSADSRSRAKFGAHFVEPLLHIRNFHAECVRQISRDGLSECAAPKRFRVGESLLEKHQRDHSLEDRTLRILGDACRQRR